MKKRLIAILVAVLITLILAPMEQSFAGVSGKISGAVEESKTGEPLVGATVRINGTSLITETDEDGEYFFINVPVGKYDLTVSHIGFGNLIKKGVRVLADLTSPVDFGVSVMTTSLRNEMVVYATEPIIQKDLTSSRVTFTADRLRELPNTITVENVLGNYPGIVVDRDQELHARGGRSGQIAYYYDGYSIQDPFIQRAGIRIMPSALEELALSSGGFGAEYGDAQSGIVSAITREGGASYHGSVESYESYTHMYEVEKGRWEDGLTRLGNRSLNFNVSGPILGMNPNKNTFFAAGEYLRNNSYLPHNWSIGYSGALKLSLQPTKRLRIKSNMTYYEADGDLYNHRDVNGRSYDFNLDGLPAFERKSYLIGFSGTYYFNNRTIASASVNRFSTRVLSSPRQLLGTHYKDWAGYSEDANGVYNGTIHENNYGALNDNNDPYQILGFTVGDDFDPTYSFRETQYNAMTASLIRQMDKTNQIKFGFEYRKYDITKDFRQFFNNKPFAETFATKPVYSSVYLQDKIEFDYMVVNGGIRWDHWNADIRFNTSPGDSIATYKNADTKERFSPRLGVSFPISESSVMHFNYGMYYQTPKFTYLYFNPQGDVTTGRPLVGNPDLSPEQTTSYELGLDRLIGNEFRFDVTAYYKDIRDLVTTRLSPLDDGATTFVTRFTNDDYGSVQGVDIEIEKLAGRSNFSGSIAYSYMVATGVGSNPLEPYYDFGTPDSVLPTTEYSLDFDQRHTATAILQWAAPESWKGNLFGLAIPGNWSLSLAGYYGSGLPFTRTDSKGNQLGQRNEERLPSYQRVDMRFNKFIKISGGRTMTFFVEVDNLLNTLNIINVYSRTGLPDDDAQSFQPGLSASQSELDEANRLYDQDPQNYSPPRSVRTGFSLSF